MKRFYGNMLSEKSSSSGSDSILAVMGWTYKYKTPKILQRQLKDGVIIF